jgi:hypothetical protein
LPAKGGKKLVLKGWVGNHGMSFLI